MVEAIFTIIGAVVVYVFGLMFAVILIIGLLGWIGEQWKRLRPDPPKETL